MLNISSQSRGDTLIEVLFASAVFSMIAVGGLAIMNQGTATIQRSLEITQVRQEIDAQASALRFLNASYIASYAPNAPASAYAAGTPARQWADMLATINSLGNTNFPAFGATAARTCPNRQNGSFIIDARRAVFRPAGSANFQPTLTYAQVSYNGSGNYVSANGIWIEAVRTVTLANNQTTADYIDFQIKACWESPGLATPMTLGTVVRLYEPIN